MQPPQPENGANYLVQPNLNMSVMTTDLNSSDMNTSHMSSGPQVKPAQVPQLTTTETVVGTPVVQAPTPASYGRLGCIEQDEDIEKKGGDHRKTFEE